jgi:hypothetical protein
MTRANGCSTADTAFGVFVGDQAGIAKATHAPTLLVMPAGLGALEAGMAACRRP